MENLTEPLSTNGQLELNLRGVSYLSEMRKWTKFLAILGFIMMGLVFVLGFILLLASGILPGKNIGPLTAIPLIIMVLIYFFPIYFLYQFSVLSKNAISYNDSNTLSRSFDYLKMHFKFIGIMTIILLVIYLIIIVVALLGASIFKSSFSPTY